MTAYGTRRAGKVALFLAAVTLPALPLAPDASTIQALPNGFIQGNGSHDSYPWELTL